MSYRVDPYDKALVIEGFDQGIADSPFNGISDLRNVDVTSVPGEASVAFASAALNAPPTVSSLAFTVSAATDTFTVASTSGWYNGMALTLNTLAGGTGLSTGRVYWVGNLSGSTFKLYINASRNAGKLVDVTLDGSGTLTSYTLTKPIDETTDFSAKTTRPYNSYFFLDDAGKAWWVDDTGGTLTNNLVYLGNTTLTGTNGRAINIFVSVTDSDQHFIWVFRQNNIDSLKISSITDNVDTASLWTYGFESISSVNREVRPTIYATDNAMYYGNGGRLGSIIERAGADFDPANSATWTENVSALLLPGGDDVNSLAELGTNLLVGGIKNLIYPWNRVATTFSYPIVLAEYGVAKMVTVNTNTYVFAGNRGNIYITNGSQANFYKKMPDHLSGIVRPYYTWGAATFHRDNLLFGVSVTSNALVANANYGGVWAIDLETDALRLLNKSSYGTYAGYVTTLNSITSNATGYGYFAGWDSGASTYGIDYTTTAPYTGSQATIDSDLIPIGTYDRPRDAVRIEYRLSAPMVNGESVALYYRLDFSQSYTLIDTDVATSSYLPYSKSFALNWKNAQWLQLRAVLNSTASSPSYTRFKEIRLTGLV